MEQAQQECLAGHFLIKELGVHRLRHPEMIRTLLTLRVQGWIGTLGLGIDHELFGQSAPAVKLRRQPGPLEGLAVENHLKKLGETQAKPSALMARTRTREPAYRAAGAESPRGRDRGREPLDAAPV